MLGITDNREIAIEQRRRLHAQIARSRRRLDQHSSRLMWGGFLPHSWRRQIQDHPITALAAAAGAGMLIAELCGRSGAASKSVDRLAEWLAGGTWTSLLKYIERLLSTRGPTDPLPASEQSDA